MEFRLKALTQIWTGGVEGRNRKLYPSGIKGSIRWYEVLIRGLDGCACDPTDDTKRCTLELKQFKKLLADGKTEEEALNSLICPACQMFGCTNWGGKFSLRIEDNSGNIITDQLQKGKLFTLKFIERKIFTPHEQKLMNATMKIITDYGAIGGRTSLKPSEVPYKNCEYYKKKNHLDYGLIEFQPSQPLLDTDCSTLSSALKKNREAVNKENKDDWPDLKNFWFVKGTYIDRQNHNQLVSRSTNNGKYNNSVSANSIFLGGFTPKDKQGVAENLITHREKATDRKTESKKIFSFHGLECKSKNCIEQAFIPRCFGYARNKAERDDIVNTVKTILNGKGSEYEIKTGKVVLDEL